MFHRTSVVLALAALVSLTAFATIGIAPSHPEQAGPPEGHGHHMNPSGNRSSTADEERARASMEERRWQGMSEEMRAEAEERAEAAHLFSVFGLDEAGNVDGRFVSFHIASAAGQLHGYAVKDGTTETTFFAQVAVEPWTLDGEPAVTGAVLRAFSDGAALAAHNNPTGQLLVRSGNDTVNVTIDLAPGVEIADPAAMHLKLVSGDAHGHIILAGGGNLTSGEGTVMAELAGNSTLLFLAHPAGATARTSALHERNAAIESGRLGGELSVVEADGEPVEEALELGVHMHAKTIEQRRVTVQIGSDNETGRAVVVHLDSALLEDADPADIEVAIDGNAAAGVASAAEVLAAEPGSSATFSATEVEGAIQVAINVPGFSDHDVTISAAEAEPTPPSPPPTDDDGEEEEEAEPEEGTPAIGVWVTLVVAGIASMVAGRRRD